MRNLCMEWKRISVLVNPLDTEQPIIDFLKEREISAERSVVVEPSDMFNLSVRRGLTFNALENCLHVDFAEDPKRILVFSFQKQELENFANRHNLTGARVERFAGETVVKYTCQRLSREVELAAMKAGLLVGRVDYQL